MRRIPKQRKNQRGCGFCLDCIPAEDRGTYFSTSRCPYEECPYHELDGVKSYDEYIKGISDVPIGVLLMKLCKVKRVTG